jgi:SAM-dependent methyltransferase
MGMIAPDKSQGFAARLLGAMGPLRGALRPLMFTPLHPKFRRFVADFRAFRGLSSTADGRFDVDWGDRYPCLDDYTATTAFDAHYLYHPAWAARIVAATKPKLHIDIGSKLDFCAMLSAFVPTEFYDFRPAEITLSNLACRRADLTALPFPDGSVESLSCMHVVEHVGLGRYGDPLDPDGDLKAIAQLKRVLAPDGSLLFVAPVGKPRLRFNAHRIYGPEQVAGYFKELKLQSFALVDDAGNFIENADPTMAGRQQYGCGCWWFKK